MDSSNHIQVRFSMRRDRDSAQAKDRFTGEILHINERGMVLLVNHSMPAEGFVTFALYGERSGICEKLLGNIKKVEPCGEGSFLVGVEYVSRVRTKKLSSPWHSGTYQLGDKIPVRSKGNHHRWRASGSALQET